MNAPRYTLDRLPVYSAIDPAGIVDELDRLISEHRESLERLVETPAAASWDKTIVPLDVLNDKLHRFFSPIAHLNSVAERDALRAPYVDCVARISAYTSELAQYTGLFACYQHIRNSDEYEEFDAARRKVIENALRDFRLGGVNLDDESKVRVTELRVALSGLATTFQQNLLDATQSYRLNVDAIEQLDGLPPGVVDLVRQNAEQTHESGWTLTLDFPCYLPAISHLNDRALRKKLYEAFVTRASDQGPHEAQYDNTTVIRDTLDKRQRLAHELGFGNYAELSLATKMAPSPREVTGFLYELAQKSKPAASAEFEELEHFATRELGLETVEPWDLNWCSEKLREHKFAFTQEDLRPYFPVPKVLEGLFEIVGTVFGVKARLSETPVDTWHDDVRFFELRNGNDEVIAYFYLDLYARQGKRGGAWMDECLVRWRHEANEQLPVAYLTCNFTPPVASQASLLTHDEVTTLFHEFGHGLHHMLTRICYPSVAGINGVPWDAVELPSQMLENWCWDYDALQLISGHHESGEPLPAEMFQRIDAARTFQAAMQMLRQIEFALFDFQIHMLNGPVDVQAELDRVRGEIAVVAPPDWNRFQHSFSHIFAGGYAAGYYSYKWAEVLAADAFSRFESDGVFNPDTGAAFRETILEQGGATDAMELFKRFRGREPEVGPLLKRAGLAA